MADEVFTVTLAPYLVAVGDGDRFYVAKHGDVASTSNRYQEVLDYVIDHRMVLERTEEGPVEGMVYPTTRSWYKRSDPRMSTAAEREARFQEHLARSVPYFAAVRAAGDLPWFEDPDKLARLESNCPGITEAPGIEAQRMLFMRRYETRTA